MGAVLKCSSSNNLLDCNCKIEGIKLFLQAKKKKEFLSIEISKLVRGHFSPIYIRKMLESY